jgi:hypothetical protein
MMNMAWSEANSQQYLAVCDPADWAVEQDLGADG